MIQFHPLVIVMSSMVISKFVEETDGYFQMSLNWLSAYFLPSEHHLAITSILCNTFEGEQLQYLEKMTMFCSMLCLQTDMQISSAIYTLRRDYVVLTKNLLFWLHEWTFEMCRDTFVSLLSILVFPREHCSFWGWSTRGIISKWIFVVHARDI